jgi:transcriptional regulator with XRE-family HTH domain
MTDSITFQDLIRAIMEKYCYLRQKDVSQRLGISASCLSRYMHLQMLPDPENLEKLLEPLGYYLADKDTFLAVPIENRSHWFGDEPFYVLMALPEKGTKRVWPRALGDLVPENDYFQSAEPWRFELQELNGFHVGDLVIFCGGDEAGEIGVITKIDAADPYLPYRCMTRNGIHYKRLKNIQKTVKVYS